MTKNEEAVEIITNALQSDERNYTEEIDKALAVVQNALEQEPCFEWIGEKAYPICPKCNCNIIEEYISCADYAEMYKPMNFCPNCGVKMESEV